MNTSFSFNKRDLFSILFKHKLKIILAFLATTVTVLVGTLLMTPVYQANSRILVKFGREYAYRPEVGNASNAYRPTLVEILNGEIQILTSRDLAEKTIAKVGLQNLYPDLQGDTPEATLEMARQKFGDGLSVKGLEESGVIEVAFQHTSPQMAAQTVNVLLEVFKEKHLETFTDPNASTFLASKAQEMEKRLRDSQEKLGGIKSKHAAYSLDEQRSLLLKQRSELDSEYKSVQDKIAETRQRRASLESQKTNVLSSARQYTATDRDRTLDETRGKLLELELKEKQLLQKYTENSGYVQQIRSDIAAVKSFLETQETEVREKATYSNPIYQDLQRNLIATTAELKSQEARSGVLRSQLAQVDGEIKNLSLPENELRTLERQVVNEEDSYKLLSSKLEEARILEDMNRLKMTNISVIQKASVPSTPVKPRKQVNMMIGIVLGAFLGLGLALVSEYISQEVSTPSQVEMRLGVPVLATIPYLPKALARPEP